MKAATTRGDGDPETVAQQPINEAEEESGGVNWDTTNQQGGGSGNGEVAGSLSTNTVAPSGGGQKDPSSATNGVQQDNPTTQSVGPNTMQPQPDPAVAGPPPGLPDPAGIEWSYLDPQGNIQGHLPIPLKGAFTYLLVRAARSFPC